MFMASLYQQGAEPKRPLCGMQRGGSVLSKRVSQAAAPGDDYCEADRAQRDSPLRRLHRLPPIEALWRVKNDEARCTARCASGNDTNRR